jgi:hypothetical protein
MSCSTRVAVLAATLLIAGCRDTSSPAKHDATVTTAPAPPTTASESITRADVLELLWLLSPTGGPCPPIATITVPPGDLALLLEVLGLVPTPPDACEATP